MTARSHRFVLGLAPFSAFSLLGAVLTDFGQAASAADIDTWRLPPPAERKIDFAKDVQPIFAQHCYDCHGPKKHESGFRLDDKEAALRGGDNGPDLLPGKSAESLLIHAVAGLREDLTMPKKGERLTTEQIGVLRAWIDQGAEWPASGLAQAKDPKQHWAFKPPVRPPAPQVRDKRWPRNEIDRFILARLEKEGLKPAPEADKITLLRRLHFDLIGLPPTIEEVDAFLADKAPNAYEKVVEKLLNSPHYGERWGRHWLDAARYADTEGFEKDKQRFIWFYRDWVVSAFNRDLPYDQFIIEQLAGDQLPNATQDQIVATGFLRNSMLNEEGGVDPEQFRMDAMFDRMDAIGKSVLGLTIQCAQCHNHKYDPLTQEEYYRMFAFLNNDHESSVVAYTPEQQRQRAELLRQMRELEERLRHATPAWEQRLAKWEESVKHDQPEWQVLTVEHVGENAQRYYARPDHSWVAAGYAPTKFTTTWRATNSLPSIAAFRLELLTDPELPLNGPGRSIKGICALTEFNVEAAEAPNPTNKVEVKIVKATADFSNEEMELEPLYDDKSGKRRVTGPVEYAIDGKDETAWGIDAGPGRRNQDRQAVFVAEKPVGFTNGTILTIKLKQNHGGWNSDDNQNMNLGRFRLSVAGATNAFADPVPKRVRDILALPREQRSPAQVATVFSFWRTTVPEFKETNDKIEALWQQWPEGAMTLTLQARAEPRTTAILRRGDWLKPGKPVGPGVPAFLHALPSGADGSRLTFAKWLVDRGSPTTARVFVNRVWQAYFGTGLVDTPEDFGMQSNPPSHPGLLDWLACEFMRPDVKQLNGLNELRESPAAGSNASRKQRSDPFNSFNDSTPSLPRPWSVKHLHRLIVTSAAYRQSSRVTPQLYAKDQFNRLLARGPRLRVEGEIVRDVALAASGLLNPKIGGPSIFAPAPEFLFKPPASYGPFNWVEETGADRYRRALYTFRRRSTPYPMLQNFDVPNADFSCVRRSRSNTPLQALTTLNETLFVECAQALARRVLETETKTDDARVTYAFRRVLSRRPTADEKAELLGFLQRQRQRIAEGWVNPLELATGTNAPPARLPSGATPATLAAYAALSRVLLNLDEAITKE
jgi:mono/diheme cytochrome c family protein